jgi:hypothetical protein
MDGVCIHQHGNKVAMPSLDTHTAVTNVADCPSMIQLFHNSSPMPCVRSSFS